MCKKKKNSIVSLVPRPMLCFILASCEHGIFFFRCVTCRVEGCMSFCVGEDSCSSQITKEGSESIVVATLRSPFVPQTEH